MRPLFPSRILGDSITIEIGICYYPELARHGVYGGLPRVGRFVESGDAWELQAIRLGALRPHDLRIISFARKASLLVS